MARRNFLAFFLLTSCLVSGQSPRYVLKGQKVTLKKDITGRPDNILWTHDGNRVVEFNGREEHVYDLYKTRVTLDRSSAELNISDLRLEDSGKYELEVSVNKKLEKSHHDVEVLDRVAKPTISCNISNSDNSGTLVCSAEPRQPVHLMMFEWHSQGSVHPGPHLQISLGGKLDDKVYNCMVRNPLTTETAAFTAKDCHTTKSSSIALIVTVIVISLLLLLLLIVGAVILYYCKKQKGCFEKRQTDSTDSTDLEKQKQCVTKGETAKTDETMPLIDGQPSGKSSAGASDQNQPDHQNAEASPSSVTLADAGQNEDAVNNNSPTVEDRLSEDPDQEEGHASNDPEYSTTSGLQPVQNSTSQTAVNVSSVASSGSPNQLQNSSLGLQNGDKNSFSLPGIRHPGQNEDEIKKKNTVADEQEGHASKESVSSAESAYVNQDTSSEQNSSTAPASPGTMEDPSNTDKSDSDPEESTKVPPGKATDPAAVGPDTGPAASDKNRDRPSGVFGWFFSSRTKEAYHQKAEASPSSVTPPDTTQNNDNIKNKNTTDEDRLDQASDELEGHASNESEPPAESDDVHQDPSSEQNSTTAPVSSGYVKEQIKKINPNTNTATDWINLSACY